MTESSGQPVPAGKIKLAVVVVVFNPDDKVGENIRSYLQEPDFFIMVDNSAVASPSLEKILQERGRSVYLHDGVNHGMAAALNLGARKAEEAGCHWLLTMDQDSRFEPGALEKMFQFAGREPQWGIISPRHILEGKISGTGNDAPNPQYVMTSGNLLNLKAYQDAGPFLEKLFIDYVDYEYCFRLRKSGYRIRVLNQAGLLHPLGEIRFRKLFGLVFHPTGHPPVRRYYAARNRLYVMAHYPASMVPEIWAWTKEIVKLLLFEEKKGVKIRFMCRGMADFLRGRYGPLAE